MKWAHPYTIQEGRAPASWESIPYREPATQATRAQNKKPGEKPVCKDWVNVVKSVKDSSHWMCRYLGLIPHTPYIRSAAVTLGYWSQSTDTPLSNIRTGPGICKESDSLLILVYSVIQQIYTCLA